MVVGCYSSSFISDNDVRIELVLDVNDLTIFLFKNS